MLGKLEVSFNSPQCGWMSIGFDDGVTEFHTTTAHAPHELALAELLRILTELQDTSSPQSEYLLKWNRDPEAFDFRFVREAAVVTITIYQYPTDERKSAERELVFSHTGEAVQVVAAFAATFEQLYSDRVIDEFEYNWRQPFPLVEFEEFKGRIERG